MKILIGVVCFIFGGLIGAAIVSHAIASRIEERDRQITAEWQDILAHVNARCEMQNKNATSRACTLVTSNDGKAVLLCGDSQFPESGGVQ